MAGISAKLIKTEITIQMLRLFFCIQYSLECESKNKWGGSSQKTVPIGIQRTREKGRKLLYMIGEVSQINPFLSTI
jgi:hypothetical protein